MFILDAILKEKAIFFMHNLAPKTSVIFSNSWLVKFKKRNNFKCRKLYGKLVSVSEITIFQEREQFR
jgi:hypothetical protein